MRKLLKNNIFKYLLSSVLFGVIYTLLSLAHKGYVEIDTVLYSTLGYSIIMCLLYVIMPKIRKLIGYDKDNS